MYIYVFFILSNVFNLKTSSEKNEILQNSNIKYKAFKKE